MKRARYLYEWFPPIIEEDLDQVKVNEVMSEFEADLLKNELGLYMFGDIFDISGTGNAELQSRFAGQLGGAVKVVKDKLTEKVIISQ